MMHDRFFLEENGTPTDIRDDRGDTPLNIAAYAGQPAAVEELLKHGADVNAKNNKVHLWYVVGDRCRCWGSPEIKAALASSSMR